MLLHCIPAIAVSANISATNLEQNTVQKFDTMVCPCYYDDSYYDEPSKPNYASMGEVFGDSYLAREISRISDVY